MKIERTKYLKQQQIDKIKHCVIMYGGGTQSTGMTLMALNDEFDIKPSFAIFADTGAEPQHVYDYLQYFIDYVKRQYDFDIITVSAGNLEKDINEYLNGNISRVAQIPIYTDTGILIRQCTNDYKIAPADKYIKQQFNIQRKNKTQENSVACMMGISVDEVQRIKQSTQWWKTLLYPLIEHGYRRDETIRYIKKHNLKEPPRSSCYFCPFPLPLILEMAQRKSSNRI